MPRITHLDIYEARESDYDDGVYSRDQDFDTEADALKRIAQIRKNDPAVRDSTFLLMAHYNDGSMRFLPGEY
jgi:hypothetical protein